jgi:HAD superfamily phosphatase (TIGR01668 family)
MGKGLKPDFYFRDIYAIRPAFLQDHGVRGVILDIDNTLVYYGVFHPTQRNTEWLEALRKAGIAAVFVSNGNEERVVKYNGSFGYPFFFKSGKPLRRGFLKAAQVLGLQPSEIAVIGDQIFTDVWGGNRCGMITCLTDPIQPEPWLRFRIKRALERPIVKRLHYTEEQIP